MGSPPQGTGGVGISKTDLEEKLRKEIREELTSGDAGVASPLMLGAKPETAYNTETAADTAFIKLIPPVGEYIYLITVSMSYGSDGDSVEIQVLDKGGVWKTLINPTGLANTSLIQGAANMKLDYVTVGATRYEVMKGDGSTVTCRAVSRGTGAWRCQIVFFTAP